jgi:hypothetical protein
VQPRLRVRAPRRIVSPLFANSDFGFPDGVAVVVVAAAMIVVDVVIGGAPVVVCAVVLEWLVVVCAFVAALVVVAAVVDPVALHAASTSGRRSVMETLSVGVVVTPY